MYRRAIRILREVGQRGEDVSAPTVHFTGEVRVWAMPTFARAILAPLLSTFCRANPAAKVKATKGFNVSYIQTALARDLDFATVPDDIIPGGLRSTFPDSDLELLVSREPLAGAQGATLTVKSGSVSARLFRVGSRESASDLYRQRRADAPS